MAKFSEEQKQIALKLVSGAKTAEELTKELKIPYDSLQEKLKEMLKLDLLTKDGFPTKYTLKKEIVEELDRRQKIEEEDKNNLRLKAIIEMQAIEPELLKKANESITEALKKEKNLTIYSIKTNPVLKQEDNYSSFLELNISVKNFRALVQFMYFYGPSSIEIIKPAKIELSAQDLQDGLIDMAEMIQKYTQYITQLLNRQEMEALHKKIVGEK
jgi:predicted transcriptional regulator